MAEPERRLAELAGALPGLTVAPGVEQRGAVKKKDRLARQLRSWLDYMRYFDPTFEHAVRLRDRAGEAVGPRAIEITRAAAADPAVLDALRSSVTALESLLPVPEPVMRCVESHAPDAVIVSPLMQKGAPQTAYIRAARRLGLPCGLCVASWDNMTTSTLIHGDPDLVTVWNEFQREEAVRLHRIPRERVAVVGAPLHDIWFDTRPGTSHAEFCAHVGLPPDRHYILYVGSSPHIAPLEERWIAHWATNVRTAGSGEVERASILVRPHPHNQLDSDQTATRRLEALPGVRVHPRPEGLLMSAAAHQEYYDTIHHSAAVVGINTSAMIEAAIVGRGVHVLLAEDLRDSHEGRPHFAYLLSAGGGLLVTADTMAEHVAGLARAIRGEDAEECRQRSQRFLRAFVRPHGLDVPATPLMVEALESLRDVRPARGSAELGEIQAIL
jgi:hypothetical protein